MAATPAPTSTPLAQMASADSSDLSSRQASVESSPGDPHAWFELGVALLRHDRFDESHGAFRKAAMLKPNWDAPRVNLSAICEAKGQLAQAEEWCRQAILINPRNVSAYFNLGQIRRARGDLSDSVSILRTALQLEPEHAQAHWSLANSLLLGGDFERGWQEFEWRSRSGDVVIDPYPQPLWRGEPLAGKTLLVHGEQGIGDEILFASCYLDLIARGARCVFVCEPRLAPILSRSFPAALVVAWQRRKDRRPAEVSEPVDYQIPAGGVPQFLRKNLSQFPQRHSFLVADTTAVDDWRRKLATLGDGLKVGISWRAGGKPREREKRTMRLVDWQPLLAMPGVRWVNLQYGLVDDELAEVERELGVVIHDLPGGDPLTDLDQFAAKMQALDLVISVGNATVHLAGALGIDAWALLPHVPAWRWMASGEHSPWYPSLTLIRQTERGDWRQPIHRAQEMLVGRLAQPSKDHRLSGRKPPLAAAAAVNGVATLNDAATTERVTTSGVLGPQVGDLGEWVERGRRHIRAGDYEEAERILRQALAHSPRYFQALCSLADVARMTKRLDLAIRLLQCALSVSDSEAVRLNLADLLLATGHIAESIQQSRRAIEIKPNLAAAYVKLGYAQYRLRDFGEAERSFASALEIDPCLTDARRNLALYYHEQGRYGEALSQAMAGLSHAVDPALWNLRGAALLGLGRADEAVESFEEALAIAPADPSSWNNLGRAWVSAGNPHAARPCFERSLQLAPLPDVWNNLGAVLRDQGAYDQAIECFRSAAESRAESAAAQRDLGAELEFVGRKDEALACYDRALELDPREASTRFTRSLLLLELGDFARGWPEYAWRFHVANSESRRIECVAPTWDGQIVAGMTLLVQVEQGLGDEIMFATCWPELVAAGVNLIVACDDRLKRLFERSFPSIRVVGAGIGVCPGASRRLPADVKVDYQVAAGTLAARMRPQRDSFPNCRTSLRPDPLKLNHWREQIMSLGPGLKVGISWRGGLKPRDRRLRWIDPHEWRPLSEVDDVHYVNLQYGADLDEVDAFRSRSHLATHSLPELDLVQQIDDVAAVVAALDLVIAVSNVNIHLAGAVGTTSWALVPCCGNWRWTVGGDRTLWYPSVELFRQHGPADWSDVFANLRKRLAAHAALFRTPESRLSRDCPDQAPDGRRSPDRVSQLIRSGPPQRRDACATGA